MIRILITTLAVATLLAGRGAQERPRALDLGITPGVLQPGPLNAITDVEGVRVGHVTLIEGDRIRTGVTAIVPHGGNLFREKVAGAVFIGNAFGKLAGSTQVDELGTIETPIVLTNTLSVAAGIEGVVRWTLDQPGNENVRSVNALVGETNDGGLNDIRGMHVRPQHVVEAITKAGAGPVAEGSVGAGTGTIAFGWKGGVGTSSRKVRQVQNDRTFDWTVGVLVQTNYGGALRINGVPIAGPSRGAERGDGAPASDEARRGAGVPADRNRGAARGVGVPASDEARRGAGVPADSNEAGSCMIVVATDAPLDARDLKRLAARAIFAMARTGSSYSNGSGDFAIAFSTHPSLRVTSSGVAPQSREILSTDAASAFFSAVLDATEEAIYNSLLKATTVTGNGRTVEALPIERVKAALGR